MLLPVPAAIVAQTPVYAQLASRQFETLPADAPPAPAVDSGSKLALPTQLKPHQPQIDEDTKIVQVIADGKGTFYLATTFGLILTDGKDWWHPIDYRDGMPQIQMTGVARAKNGDIWGGTQNGVWRLRDGKFRYFASRRWLPSDAVKRVWCDDKDRCWVETDKGFACLEEKPMTLAYKAAHYEEIAAKYHNRRGYLSNCSYKVAGKPELGTFHEASDNDGLWTSVYLGAECLRYGATKDPKAKALAKKSLNALLELERLTGIPGFPARATVTDDELKAGVTGMSLNDKVPAPGGGETPIWFRSPVEKNVWMKGDTSSDEIAGHYFAWFLYDRHVADPEEKKRIAATCKRVTDYILDHGYTLPDHTTLATRWGHWEPSLMNDSPYWKQERGLNSLEILSHLKVAYALTGEKRYEQAYEDLINKHHYLLNILTYRRNTPWWRLNHSDDELAYLAYYPLMLLEKDPARKLILSQSLARTWEPSLTEQTIKAEASPFYNFMYGALTGSPCDVESAQLTLQDWPLDQTEWKMSNSVRLDVALRVAPGGGRNRTETDRVLSPAERGVTRWNACYWEADTIGEGRGADDPGAWLIGYWLGVYHGYLRP